jgi:ABC-2 type transport system permease protein
MFSCIGLLVAALPIRFSTASTLFSITSFLMLFSGYLGAAQPNHSMQALSFFNPLNFSKKIFTGELPLSVSLIASATLFLACLSITARHFRIHPVWSRY